MADFLSDEDMQKLEDEGQATVLPASSGGDYLSDDDMQRLEDAGHASDIEPPKPKVSQLESAARGGLQGLSLGFGDELAGANDVVQDAMGGRIDYSKLLETYSKHRDQSRMANQSAKEDNPLSYTGAELAGGAAGAFIPGLNVAKGVKGAATVGGAMGLGLSEADLTQGEVAPAAYDAAKGVILGGITGKGLDVASKAIKGAPAAADALASKLAPNAPKTVDGAVIERFGSPVPEQAVLGAESALGEAVSGTGSGSNLAKRVAGGVGSAAVSHALGGGMLGKAVGIVTGSSIGKLGKVATTKGLEAISSSLKSVSNPEAQGLSSEIYKLSQNPELSARIAGLSALLSNPTTKDLLEPHIQEAPKEVKIKTPSTTLGGEKMKNVGYDRKYDEESLNKMQMAITPEMGNVGSQLRNVLESIKTRDFERRGAMMFALEQNPAYRPLIKKLRGDNEDLAK